MNRTLAVFTVVSALTLAYIAGHEGYRSSAYDDGAGVQTLGFGATTHESGRAIKPGDTTHPTRAVLKVAQDATRLWSTAAACIADVPLYPHEASAMQSLVFNIGPGAFCRSTLVKKLKQTPPDYVAACAEILRWNRAGGRVWPGLQARRAAEYAMCMGSTP